jgi:uncharacterized sporulation protein YeaH/YhbH (DUF444 family)
MGTRAILLSVLFVSALAAQNLEKTQKKELEIEAIKRLDGEIEKRLKDSLSSTRKLYEAKKYKESAAALEEAMKLQAYQTVLAHDLALCYFQLGERDKALEYLGRAKSGTGDPKRRQALLELLTHFTTGEDALSVSDNDKTAALRTNHILRACQYYAYLEVGRGSKHFPPGFIRRDSDLWQTYSTIIQSGAPMAMRKVGHRRDIYPVFRELFAKKTGAEAAAE